MATATAKKTKVTKQQRQSNKGKPQGQIRLRRIRELTDELDGRTAIRVDWDGSVAPVAEAVLDEKGHIIIKVRVS